MGKSVTRNSERHTPRMMTVREVAATGILPENAIRVMLKEGRIPAIYIGRKALINYDALCDQLEELRGGNPNA